ncbi:MAG: 3-dehydroquinate synthase [Hyphomicrobiaceae bacterium]
MSTIMTMAEAGPAIVPVALGGRSYDILIGPGLIGRLGDMIAERWPGARVAMVTDATVEALHGAAVARSLSADSLLGTVVVPPGEASKSYAELARVVDELLGLGVERNDIVVALGGGVIGDLAGFAASVLRRGVRFVQVPTTLLAQVDSSIGGKTGINSRHGKNLVGAFHQPILVSIDTTVLETLPIRQLRAGYAEVAKYGLLGDGAFFEWLERHQERVMARDAGPLRQAIETSCRAKAKIVARDETETGERALLNLGHTFGHALEAWAGFSDRLLHGEAIAIGMVLAFAFSERRGLAPSGTSVRVRAHFERAGLPTRVSEVPGQVRPSPEALVSLMAQDKKVMRGKPTLVLAHGIGQAFVSREQSWAEIEDFLTSFCN